MNVALAVCGVEPLSGKTINTRQKLPSPRDRFLLKIRSKAPISKHLEKCVVINIFSYVIKIIVLASSTDTLLRVCSTLERCKRTLWINRSHENGLELVHPSICEKKGRVIEGNHTRRRPISMASILAPVLILALEKIDKGAAHASRRPFGRHYDVVFSTRAKLGFPATNFISELLLTSAMQKIGLFVLAGLFVNVDSFLPYTLLVRKIPINLQSDNLKNTSPRCPFLVMARASGFALRCSANTAPNTAFGQKIFAPNNSPHLVLLPGFGNDAVDYTNPFGAGEDRSILNALSVRGFRVHVMPLKVSSMQELIMVSKGLNYSTHSGPLTNSCSAL